MNTWLKKHAVVLGSLGAIAAITGLLVSLFSPAATPPPTRSSSIQAEGDVNISADNGATNVINIGAQPSKDGQK